jgi:hypothetical protein
MRTLTRLYIGWRLLRLSRPVLVLATIASVLLVLHVGHVAGTGATRSTASTLEDGAGAGQRDLTSALERAFEADPAPGTPAGRR